MPSDHRCQGRRPPVRGRALRLVLCGFAADALLDDDLAIVTGSKHDGGRELRAVVNLGDADRGAEIRRLDEERIAEAGFDLRDGFARRLVPRTAEQRDVLDDGKSGGSEEALHYILVHACCGAEDAGADVGFAGELEESLDGAVLAKGAVQNGKEDIDAEGLSLFLRGRCGHVQQACGMRGWHQRAGMCGAGFGNGGSGDGGAAGEHMLRVVCEQPVAGFGDADGDDVVFLSVDSGKYGGGGAQRDFVLARAAAKDDSDAEFPRHSGQSISVIARASVTRSGEVYGAALWVACAATPAAIFL